MSNEWDDDSDNTSGPKALREAYEDQKRKNKELADQLSTLADEVRISKLERKFTAKGVPEKAAKLFPKDKSPDEVDTWLEEFGDVLGLKGSEPPNNPSEPSQVSTPPSPVNPIAGPLEQMNSVVTNSQPAPSMKNLESALANPNLSEDEFLSLMREAGARV